MRLKKISFNSIKHKMEDEPPDIENDKRNSRNNDLGNSQRHISDSLLYLRWKTAGNTCIITDNFNNFVKLLYN